MANIVRHSLIVLSLFTSLCLCSTSQRADWTGTANNAIDSECFHLLQVLGDRVNQLEAKLSQLEVSAAREVDQLTKRVADLESARVIRQTPVEAAARDGSEALTTSRNTIPRTCHEAKMSDPLFQPGMHYIDPDGTGVGDDPIYVYCDASGTTSVPHDSELATSVTNCEAPGCYSRPIVYDATIKQMTILAGLSFECHQSIQYDCLAAPFEFNGVQQSFWNDRDGVQRHFWAGTYSANHTCQCGIDGNCGSSNVKCNCDTMAPVQFSDSGIITDKAHLPITRLNFGYTHLTGASGRHTLGRFQCSGGAAVSGYPTSCADLFRIGHTLSGYYLVKGSNTKVDTVYCDFASAPSAAGYQTRVGNIDIKSSSVQFYVQRNSRYSNINTVLPFEVERLNVGNAMNLATGIFTAPVDGTYQFALSGVKDWQNSNSINMSLRVNGAVIASANGHWGSDAETFALDSVLKLKVGDRIDTWLSGGGGIVEGDGYTHFSGSLMEQDLRL